MSILLTEFLKNPVSTGSVCPSSAHLAKSLLDSFDWQSARKIVELGPGTGAVTKHILPRLHPDADFFAVEMNPHMAATFHGLFPGVRIITDKAENLRNILSEHDGCRADIIISSLPWANMPSTAQDSTLDAVYESLNDGGCFSTFGYAHGMLLKGARGFRCKLARLFPLPAKTSIIWCNLPPAFCYICHKEKTR